MNSSKTENDARTPVNGMVAQLTEGSIWKSISYLAIPMMLSQLFHSALSLVDMAWVGRLGSVALASVAMTGVILMVAVTVIGGLCTGTRALVSRYVGSGNEEFASRVALQSLILGAVTAVLLAVLAFPFVPVAFRLMGARPEVVVTGTPYLRILLVGGCTTFILFLGSSILHGSGDAYTPMKLMLCACLLNVVLDPLLIFGIGFPRMEVRGAALASVIAQGIAACSMLFILLQRHHIIRLNKVRGPLDMSIVIRILKIGIPNSFQMAFRTLMAMVLMAVVAGYGTAAVAAYGVGVRLRMLVLMPGLTLGVVAATLVGQNLGARKLNRARTCALQVALINVAIMVTAGAVYFLFAGPVIKLFNNDSQVISVGVSYLRTTTPFYVFTAFSIVLGRALVGAGDTVPPMLITLVALWGIQIPLALILPRLTGLGIAGVWWATVIACIVEGLGVAAWFQKGLWKHKKI